MANRVTDADVRTIITTSIADTTPFITAANALVNRMLLDKYDESYLREIELYLSAHYVCAADPRVVKEKVGDAETTYQTASNATNVKAGLKSTSYGEIVLSLDTLGILASSTAPKASLSCIATDVQDRW